MGDQLESLPLFPLGIVLLPSEMVQLHIFEERYKLMIGECLEHGSEFGIVWLSDERLHEVGCTARVTEVLERYDDGRMDILVAGRAPFRMERRIDDLAYPAGDVRLLDLDPAPGDPALAAEARERYADLVEHVTDERPPGSAPGRRGARRRSRSRSSTRSRWRARSSSSPRRSSGCWSSRRRTT